MAPKYHTELIQGTEEWHAARCGLLTASEMKLILTPTLKTAKNDKTRAHLYELAAQRITNYTEPSYIGDDMLRGWEDEILARDLYSETHGLVEEVGFITNDKWGFTLGYSPDGKLKHLNGGIEIKSRRQKFQIETILTGEVPAEYVLQIQSGLLVAEWDFIDFISYSGGLPMWCRKVNPDDVLQAAIIEAAEDFEHQIAAAIEKYEFAIEGLPPTERRVEQEMHV